MTEPDRRWDKAKRRDEAALLSELRGIAALSPEDRARISANAATLVRVIRSDASPSLMDVFLAEYGLSTEEGVALMCLAEALLRVPDPATIDALIDDKIASSDWSSHLGQSGSPLVNASTWALLMTSRVLSDEDPSIASRLRGMVRRLGEPIIRAAVSRAMREMGQQFVLGQTIGDAMTRASAEEARGLTYSYDMLGEAAMTAAHARGYKASYANAIDAIAAACVHDDIDRNPGISVKLSALHPRYEIAKSGRVMDELAPVLLHLAQQAAQAGMGLNVDAEEADRLGLSLAVIETVLSDPSLAGWDGFGVVVQAYGRRAGEVIDGLYDMARTNDRKIMIRLVKGAYWDTEIKHAQVEGLGDFPVFTRKAATDVSFIANARRLLGMTDRIYPQFATHNAHSVAAVLDMAQGLAPSAYEFQRLHGMGAALHDIVREREGTRCRVYAPVGVHRDLLAYLVRRLLENGANSSFVNQIYDAEFTPEDIAVCPFDILDGTQRGPAITPPADLFRPDRTNSTGFDINDTVTLDRIRAARARPDALAAGPILAGPVADGEIAPILNPATSEAIGTVTQASVADVDTALAAAAPWTAPAADRAAILNAAADLYEADFGVAFSLLAAEAGKTLRDAVAELREAVDFLRYYAAQAEHLTAPPCGLVTCISPWNFPLAIFTGQIAAALAAGNAVLAKPAETTPAIAAWAVQKLHAAGIPQTALQLLPGTGATIGAALTSDPRIGGVAFTGSTATAKRIRRSIADGCAPGTPLIAETGGLNAVIVDSTALLEQAVGDIVASAFQSSGQRCSALRCLYVQDDIADALSQMLIGAMDELTLGDPWDLATDVGPIITPEAAGDIAAYVERCAAQGRLIHRLDTPAGGAFVGPALIRVDGIADLEREVFGPVLHLAVFAAADLDTVVSDINATGYGLTFGVQTRIDDRVDSLSRSVAAGNIYVNRNQIGAVVGSQPFGGDGLSGTGPKAGGPLYVPRFTSRPVVEVADIEATHDPVGLSELQSALSAGAAEPAPLRSEALPGPTGELNELRTLPRAPFLCLGPGPSAAHAQAAAITALGGRAVACSDDIPSAMLTGLRDLGGVVWWGDADTARTFAHALADRDGPILPLITGGVGPEHVLKEKHLCVDTTAAGGNAALLGGSSSDKKGQAA